MGIVVSDLLCSFRILEIATYRTMCGLLFMKYYRTFGQVCKYHSIKYVIKEFYLQSCPDCE